MYNGLKDEYLKAREKSIANGNKNTVYTMEMLRILAEMAVHDVWPDGRFGDDECLIWETLKYRCIREK